MPHTIGCLDQPTLFRVSNALSARGNSHSRQMRLKDEPDDRTIGPCHEEHDRDVPRIYNNRIASLGRINFTVAHEFGALFAAPLAVPGRDRMRAAGHDALG